jgi:hypothetical protein
MTVATKDEAVKGWGGLPLFIQLPLRCLLGNPLAAGRIGIRDRQNFGPYRGVLRVEDKTPSNALG